MEKLREKLNSMRAEAEAAHERADRSESDYRRYETLLAEKDAEILGLKNKATLLEGELQRQESRIDQIHGGGQGKNKNHPDVLARRIEQLEEQIDTTETELKTASEKQRQLEVVAEQFERRANQLKEERQRFDAIYDEISRKYSQVKTELENTLTQLETI